MINALNNTRTYFTAAAAVAGIVGLSACGGSTTDNEGAAALPAAITEAPAASVAPAEQPASVEQVEAAASAGATAEVVALGDSGQVIPASGPDLPCVEYVAATELPLHACSQGPLVEDFQNWAAYVSMDVDVDGFFGEATYDAVIEFQRQFGLIETGVIDQVLMDTLEANLIHDEEVVDESFVADEGDVWVEGDGEGEIHDESMSQYCQELNDGLHPDANITAELIEICDSLDVRIASGD